MKRLKAALLILLAACACDQTVVFEKPPPPTGRSECSTRCKPVRCVWIADPDSVWGGECPAQTKEEGDE